MAVASDGMTGAVGVPVPEALLPLIGEVRAVFSRGTWDDAATLLVDARQRGFDWERATQAAAEGTAVRFGFDQAPAAPRPANAEPPREAVWRPLLAALALYILLRPFAGFAHELAVALSGLVLHGLIESGAWQPLLARLPLDPVYAGAAIRYVGNIEIQGLAVAGAVGEWLHALVPVVFLAPAQAMSGAGTSVVAAPGGAALARGLAAFGGDLALLTLGLWLFISGRRQRRSVWPVLGLLLQAQIVFNHFFDRSLNVRDLDASGLPFALALLAPSTGWFTESLASLGGTTQRLAVGGVLLLAGYLGALAVLGLGWGVARAPRLLHAVVWRARTSPRGYAPRPARALATGGSLWLSAALAAVTALSPVGALARGHSNWQAHLAIQATLPDQGAAWLGGVMPADGATAAGPSHVEVVQATGGGWQYLVNGVPTVIRGVGYNPQYAALPTDERASLYDRDFAAMRLHGVNTIEGWFENQFDEVTLAHAAESGIGVLMPFELNQDWNYADPAFQAQLLDRISAWVVRYRDEPAVRMWAPGNENMHRVLYAKWVSQANVPAARAKAAAFAAFLPKVVDRIHELDPNHPVIYRDAEDVYLTQLKDAFEHTGIARPWLVYGTNVYALPRLTEIIQKWPSQWLGGPLVISEYAPGGVGPADRPVGLENAWKRIRARPDVVLGGLAYTWATNGPEDLDRVFGFVDQNGKPRDGGLAMLGALYLNDMRTTGQG